MADTINDAAQAGNDAAQAGNDAAQAGSDEARAGTERMQEAGRAIADNGSTIGIKMIEQAETNTREAFAAMRAAAGAKDLADVMRIQGEFLREQGNRSMSQAREVSELIMQFGRNAVAPFRQG